MFVGLKLARGRWKGPCAPAQDGLGNYEFTAAPNELWPPDIQSGPNHMYVTLIDFVFHLSRSRPVGTGTR